MVGTSSTAAAAANATSSISSYEVVRLLKQPDNRLCADCSTPLTQSSLTYASLVYGVWVCGACAEVHRDYLQQNDEDKEKARILKIGVVGQTTNIVKRSTDEWHSHEIAIMVKCQSNIQVNKMLERYVPSAWEKINGSSSSEERRQWIQAKYYSRYFMIPQEVMDKDQQPGQSSPKKKKKKSKQDRQDRIDNIAVLPSRLVDYFIVLGYGKIKLPPSNSKQNSPAPVTKKSTLLPEKVEDWHFHVDIQDCYPGKDSHEDTPIPELLGPMVFPSGLSLCSQEKSPYCFSFVLTDINRVKLYGTTLIFYELVDPEKLITMNTSNSAGGTEEHRQQMKEEMQQHLLFSKQKPVLYAPKALTLLSHYGFYHLYSLFLSQFYHLSLSSSSLPLERYLLNFMEEVPLPPQGRIEVSFTLPEYSIHISRPPKNQLPMVDFSYRPLFALLQVDTILTVFRALCLEMTVCICCSNVALLTPIQEALLSLLYPLVWQGCYVPILPRHMIELLDAPVPLLVGLHDSYLYDTPREHLPQNVLFIHVDKDEVIFEEDFNDLAVSTRLFGPDNQIPKSKLDKLRSKLIDFGGCIYRKDMQWVKAGYPFQHNEHLIPLKGFISEQGAIAQHRDVMGHGSGGLFSTQQLTSSLSKLGIRRTSTTTPSAGAAAASAGAGMGANGVPVSGVSTKDTKKLMGANKISLQGYEAVPYRHPAASTLILATTKTRAAVATGSGGIGAGIAGLVNGSGSGNTAQTKDLLDPENNYDGQDSPNHFNAKEIREAFLRFFVASFIDYQSYLKAPNPATNSANGDNGDDPLFDSDAFVASLQDEFLAQIVRSQMFTNFISERAQSPDQPEIQFFDENILAKKNRSKLVLAKTSTPFLSDDTDFLREVYTVPPPSTTGLTVEESSKGFAYHAFPSPLQCQNARHSQVVRKAAILTSQVEKKRLQDRHNKAMSYLEQQMTLLHQYNTQNSTKATPTEDGDGNEHHEDDPSTTGNATKKAVSFLDYSLQRYQRVDKAIAALQRRYKYVRPARTHFLSLKAATTKIWRFYLHARQVKRERYRHYLAQIVRIQTIFRCYRMKKRLLRYKHAVICVQSHFRQKRVSRKYQLLRSRVIIVQARYRGYRLRVKQYKQFTDEIERYKVQLLVLWSLEHTPMRERALFWLHLCLSSSLSPKKPVIVKNGRSSCSAVSWTQIALYREELQRLYRSLCLYPTPAGKGGTKVAPAAGSTLGVITGFDKMPFDQQFATVSGLSALQSVKSVCGKYTNAKVVNWKELVPAMTTAIDAAAPKISGTPSTGPTTAAGTKPLPASLSPAHHNSDAQQQQLLQDPSRWQKLSEQEKHEREDVYSVLQNYFSSTTASPALLAQEERWFELFQIQQHKYRKRKISRYVWVKCDELSHADISCRLMLTILYAGRLPAPPSGQPFVSDAELIAVSQDWLEEKRRERMSRHTVETVRAFVKVISQLKAENKRLKALVKPGH